MPVGERSASLPATPSSAPQVALVAARFEAKYRIERAAAAALREQLATRLTSHHHSVPPGARAHGTLRHITTTVYFDTVHRDLCRAATRAPVHFKVRARTYRDEPHESLATEPLVWVELKERDGTRSRKRRAPVEYGEAARWFAALAIEDAALARRVCEARAVVQADPACSALLSDLAQVRSTLEAPLVPSCVVRYSREAFQDATGTLRVTFDDGVRAFAPPAEPFEPGALEPPRLGAPRHEETGCVLETKSLGEPPQWLTLLLAAHGARAIEYSKLVMASIAVHGRL